MSFRVTADQIWSHILSLWCRRIGLGSHNGLTLTHLQIWLETLPEVLQTLVITLTRSILEDLSKTGVEPSSFGNRNLVVAWPTANGTPLCLKFPCTGESGWAQILEDSDECATFAYVTTQCLTTDKHPCNRASCVENANRIPVLATAISSAEAEQVMNSTAWTIEDGQTYYFRKFEGRIMVKAHRDPARGVAELIVTLDDFFNSPAKLWRQSSGVVCRRSKRIAMKEEARRDQLIRERLQEGHDAEGVFIRVKGCRP